MSQIDEIQLGKDRYIGARLAEHDKQVEELRTQVQKSGEEPVEVPEPLAGFVAGLRLEGARDDALIGAVFEHFGLGAFSDRQIAAALVAPTEEPQSEPEAGDPPPVFDEDPGE